MKVFATLAVMFALTVPVMAQDQPQLSEVDKLKIEILNLQFELRKMQETAATWISNYGQCQVQLLSNKDSLNNMAQQLERTIEKNHPGFDFNIQTGDFKALKPKE